MPCLRNGLSADDCCGYEAMPSVIRDAITKSFLDMSLLVGGSFHYIIPCLLNYAISLWSCWNRWVTFHTALSRKFCDCMRRNLLVRRFAREILALSVATSGSTAVSQTTVGA